MHLIYRWSQCAHYYKHLSALLLSVACKEDALEKCFVSKHLHYTLHNQRISSSRSWERPIQYSRLHSVPLFLFHRLQSALPAHKTSSTVGVSIAYLLAPIPSSRSAGAAFTPASSTYRPVGSSKHAGGHPAGSTIEIGLFLSKLVHIQKNFDGWTKRASPMILNYK